MMRKALGALIPVLLTAGGLWVLTNGSAGVAAEEKRDSVSNESSMKKESDRQPDSACLTDESVLREIRRRRSELDAREKLLGDREAEVAAKERAVEEQLKRIESVREEIRLMEAANEAKTEENVSKLVETLEKMSPKASSKILAGLDDRLAVVAMKRIESAKLAKIMNLMDPERSSKLSQRLAGIGGVARAGGSDGEQRAPAAAGAAAGGK